MALTPRICVPSAIQRARAVGGPRRAVGRALIELGRTISPAAAREILGATYRALPDSAAAREKVDENESASTLQRAVAQLLRGACW
ncbi:MAG TPA: hypothetical protein VEJ23_06445 [Solirubrobacteraceae bacterium]|nr:hypothetical protein [Solirubrobacteraceae bacterium]